MRSRLVTSLFLTALAPAAPGAQQRDPDRALVTSIATLRQGAPVRVSFRGARFRGPFGGFQAETLRVGGRSVPIAAVDSLWVARRRVREGAMVGGFLGGVAGAGLGLIVAGVCDAAECPSLETGAFAGGAIGLGGGAVLGGAVGALFRGWRRLHP